MKIWRTFCRRKGERDEEMVEKGLEATVLIGALFARSLFFRASCRTATRSSFSLPSLTSLRGLALNRICPAYLAVIGDDSLFLLFIRMFSVLGNCRRRSIPRERKINVTPARNWTAN